MATATAPQRVDAAAPARLSWPRLAAAALALAGLGALLRLRYLSLPWTPDEGGYAYVARGWARGADLYADVWADRPQALFLLYRLAAWLGGDGVEAVRALAIAAAIAITLALCALVARLATPLAALAAAGLFSILSVAPRLEGFTANGELLAAAPATVALALFAGWLADGRRGWLVGAGLCAGSALLVKQSGYDAGLAIAAWLALAAWRGWRPRREALVALGVVAAAAAVPLALAAVHGLATGAHDWWYAVAGYRLEAESIATRSPADRLSYLWDSLHVAWPTVLPLLALAAVGVTCLRRSPERLLLGLWGLAALTGFALGGLFHPHYYMGLLPALCALAGLGVARIGEGYGRLAAAGAVALALMLPVADALPSFTASSDARASELSSHDPRLLQDGPVADWLAAHTAPGEPIYALYSSAAVYQRADRPSPYPYLWYVNVERIPGALDDLRAVLAGPDAPRYVALYHPPSMLDQDGRLRAVLDERYRQVATVAGIPILERT